MLYQPKIFVIILNWNGKEDTCQCLNSVQAIEYSNYEVVVVDNGSQDDSVCTFKDKFPKVFVLETGQNLGYAGGNNQGITYALEHGADHIFILNNDAIVDPNILNSFVEAIEKYPDAGILGAKIYQANEPNKIWFAGGTWLPEKAEFTHIGWGHDDGPSWSQVQETDYACGCALFVKAEVFRKIGLLETKFFLTWEESDFCYRARRCGYKCLLVPNAHVWHKVSASFKGGEAGLIHKYFMTRNQLLWIERNQSVSERIRIYQKIITPKVKRYIRILLSPKSDSKSKLYSRVHLTAIKDYFFRNFGDCPSWIRCN
jgi:hypothetical protein